jgi:hypothetical protein
MPKNFKSCSKFNVESLMYLLVKLSRFVQITRESNPKKHDTSLIQTS